MTILLGLLGNFWPYILAGLAAVWWGIKQRRAGAASERAKREAADRRVNIEAEEIEDAIAGRSPEENRKELRKWAKR